ncbi:uncharacterized protein K452DRAFT_82944 [Aplosporella prunicola CBS 121167]|uniref:Uncharacterized protein n=1 Tax=Aplosporella prunicola CBS 121167 TaxID=1176127 RepID=A0A6A6B374_9PEZI|nr:uncharacterized protein K452DRAFT_82944 [Aplosporella prunicola CBS 121167]KAF2138672.1 hypothetical protein K452DRAFT_82944 [Aplosporella prunicola CBS 121167]
MVGIKGRMDRDCGLRLGLLLLLLLVMLLRCGVCVCSSLLCGGALNTIFGRRRIDVGLAPGRGAQWSSEARRIILLLRRFLDQTLISAGFAGAGARIGSRPDSSDTNPMPTKRDPYFSLSPPLLPALARHASTRPPSPLPLLACLSPRRSF